MLTALLLINCVNFPLAHLFCFVTDELLPALVTRWMGLLLQLSDFLVGQSCDRFPGREFKENWKIVYHTQRFQFGAEFS